MGPDCPVRKAEQPGTPTAGRADVGSREETPNAAATDQQPPRRRQQPPHRDPERPPDQGWRRRLDRAPVLAVLTVLAVLEYNRVERGAGDTSPDPTAGPLWHHPEQEPPGRGGRRMPPLEPLWVAFVTVVLAGCVVLGVRAVRRRRGRR